ncbi:rna-binding protein [Venturia nashicola]|uniref:Rna-binding protein n=1 Tax=Venturia nashicola TaxID=86259 RepID=A0A4Z1NGJ2_9PEZI|nr:rna-binding protein [Venturia nashicola]TLD20243.1 rna-binding protein [Venturia nashicola]
MSATPPQEAVEFRGNSHTPVSPKPSYFPSPANIPILEAQMDPTFNETMMQTMHPDTFSSTTAPPATQLDFATAPGSMAGQSAQSASNAPGIDSAQEDDGSDGFVSIQEAEEQYPDHEDNSNVNVSQGTTTSLLHAPVSSSEAVQAVAAFQSTSGVDHASLDPPTATADDPIELEANTQTDPNQNPQATQTTAPLDLDAILAGLEKQAQASAIKTPPVDSTTTAVQQSKSELSALPPNPNLPPKPPAQDLTSHPNFTTSSDIRSYHPHNQKDAPFRAAGLSTLNTNGLPQPPHSYQTPLSSTFVSSTQSPAVSNLGQREGSLNSDDEEVPLDPHIQRLYDQFLTFERQNVADGQWDKFAVGSRLFIGNLTTEKVSKKDLYRRFYKYGQLAQISLKQAYGFVQFLDAETCHRALTAEQGQKMRGREMHLEISKPQKNTRARDSMGDNRGTRRRSRSPDYSRGGNQPPRGIDRYSSGSQNSPRERDYRRGPRDDYRRSISPRGGRRNNIDRYDGRRRSRSRSPPHGRGSRPPIQNGGGEDDLPLPRRGLRDVPDVQIIFADDLDRQFVEWAEKSIQARGLRVNVLYLAPHLSEDAVIKRQILEGVQAVVRLLRVHQLKGKIPLQVFDRRGGHHNVQFEQYEDLDPATAAALVLRAKPTHGAPVQQAAYGMPPQGQPAGYGMPPQQPPPTYGYAPPAHHHPPPKSYANHYGPPPVSSAPPQQAPHYPPPGQTQPGPDLVRILGQLGNPPPQQQASQGYPPRPQQPPYGQPPPQSPYGQPPQQPYVLPQQQYSASPAQQYSAPPSQPPSGFSGTPAPPQDIQALLANLSAYKPPA